MFSRIASQVAQSSLTRAAVRGAGWTIGTGIGARALGLVGTIVLTHLLVDPAIIGEVSDAVVLVLTAQQLSTLGVGQYLIAKPSAGRDAAWHATVLHLGLGALALSLVVVLRQRFTGILGAPGMAAYVPGLALASLFDRIYFIPERLLARDMRFRVIGLSRTYGELSYTVLSVLLAFLGMGGLAIVLGNVARSALRLVVILRAVDRKEWLTPSRLSRKTFRDMLAFGVPFSVAASAAFASRRWDNLLVSALFGPGVMGEYNLAYNLADIPAVQVGEQIGDVLLPSFAHMAPARRAQALVRSTALLSLVVFPLAVGLGVLAPTAVSVLLPRTWANVAPMLTVLSALSVTRPVGWTVSSYLQACDRPRVGMGLEIFKVILLVPAIYGLGHLGGAHAPLWACAGVGVAFGGHALASLAVVAKLDGLPMRGLVARMLPALAACVPLVLAVLAARHALAALGGPHPGALGLVAEIGAGGIGYVGGAFVLARGPTSELIGLLRHARSKR